MAQLRNASWRSHTTTPRRERLHRKALNSIATCHDRTTGYSTRITGTQLGMPGELINLKRDAARTLEPAQRSRLVLLDSEPPDPFGVHYERRFHGSLAPGESNLYRLVRARS